MPQWSGEPLLSQKTNEQTFRIACDKYEVFDNQCFENLELKFCKSILGVHIKSSNTAVRELGRHPNPHTHSQARTKKLV